MNQTDQNINKDMFDSDLIDVESLDYSDDQTWLCRLPEDSGQKLDIVTWNLSCDWPIDEDEDYQNLEKQLYILLDSIIKSDAVALPDKQKFDSRTYVRPKKRVSRPSIHNIVEVPSNPASISPHPSLNSALNPMLNPALNHAMIQGSANKYLTYNKYNSHLGGISPLLRLKTFNVDTHTDNSTVVKEYALKRKSLAQDEDPQLEDIDMTLVSDTSGRLSMDHTPSKPINIDLSQPAHNLHNTFNKGVTNMFDRPSLNMYQSGESLMHMSPPSLVSSLLMDSSGTFNPESMEGRKPAPAPDTGLPPAGRDSIDPMVTSMTLSILDEKDMSTSFLSQTTYPDHDSLLDSLPPSLVNSVNSSYVVPNSSKPNNDSNIFSSATFTHLEQSERLLSARPRCQLYNSFTKRDSGIRNSESYTKSREEACQIDTVKVLNENTKESSKTKSNVDMTETITLHYSNNKFIDAEKENFEKDDAFYKEMGVPKPEDSPRNSLNVTLGKQELNEIIQARQKLSLARRGLPSEPDKPLPNQIDSSPIKTIQLPNQTITVPKQSMENASELLSRRRAMNNGFERSEESREMPVREVRDTPKRHATFKVASRPSGMDTTVVYMKAEETPPSDNNIIDINSATINLLNEDQTLQHEDWGSQERAMVGSSESTDTGTFSSSSPPDSVPDTLAPPAHRDQVASTPLIQRHRVGKSDLLNTTTISPIYDMIVDKSYTLTKAPSIASTMERTYDMNNTTVVNSATIVKKSSAKRDILACRSSPDKKATSQIKPNRTSPTGTASHGSIVPPSVLPLRSGLPTSKLRQYSSHRELSRIPGMPPPAALSRVAIGAAAGRAMVRRGVYASNPALSPTAAAPPAALSQPLVHKDDPVSRPVLTNPPALVRQGTETLRRERPASQLVAPRDLRGAGSGVPVAMRTHHMSPPTTRPYSIAGAPPPRAPPSRPASVPVNKPVPAPVTDQPRPATSSESRTSALPRPSRLPAPRRALRPPSTYTVAPSADVDHY